MNKPDSEGVDTMPTTVFTNNNSAKRPANLPSGKRRGWDNPAKIEEVSQFEKPKKGGLASDDEYEDDEFIEDLHQNTPPQVQPK